jgi:hypothetical protein
VRLNRHDFNMLDLSCNGWHGVRDIRASCARSNEADSGKHRVLDGAKGRVDSLY